MLILLYGCTTWALSKLMEKKLDGNYTRMLQSNIKQVLEAAPPTKQQLYGHLPPIMKAIQVRRTRHVGHCWRSRDKLISDILQWTPSHGWAKTGQPARTYIQDIALKIYQEQWMIEKGGGRRSKRSVQAAQHYTRCFFQNFVVKS